MLLAINHILGGHCDINKAHGLALAGARPGITGDAHAQVTAQGAAHADGHFAGRLPAHSAVAIQSLLLHIEQLIFNFIGVAHHAAHQVFATTGHVGYETASQATTAGFRKGNGFTLRQKLLTKAGS